MPNVDITAVVNDPGFNTLDVSTQLFFVRFLAIADQAGRYFGDPSILRSTLYPQKAVRATDILRRIHECESAGMIACYEVQSTRYIVHRFGNTKYEGSTFPTPPDSPAFEPDQERREGSDHNGPTPSLLHKKAQPKVYFSYDGDGKVHGITPELLEYWTTMYPAISVDGELRKASAWLDANRKNRKTDVKRFLANWLSRAQDRAPRVDDNVLRTTNGKKWDI